MTWGPCLIAWLLCAAHPGRADPDVRSTVLELAAKAASDRADLREAALDDLADLGAPGLTALREVMGGVVRASPAQRRAALRALNLLTEMDPPQRREDTRRAGKRAFENGDYNGMARNYARLAVLSDASVDDGLWNGHARQLAGRWASAVAAYQLALARIDELLKNPPPRPPGRGAFDKGIGRGPGPAAAAEAGWSQREKQELLDQRSMLILLIGRLQREECGDADAAAATFAAAADHLPLLNRPTEQIVADYVGSLRRSLAGARVPHLPGSQGDFYAMQAMSEVAVCKERMGQLGDALSAWDRAYSAGMLCTQYGGLPAVVAMARLAQRLPVDAPLPPLHWLIALTDEASTVTLKMADPQTLARAWQPSANPNAPHNKFALIPPPGREFAAIRFSCDLEQHRVRYGVPFVCSASVAGTFVTLGSIDWRKDKPGRETIERTFQVPPRAEMVLVTAGSWRDKFTLHEVKAAATFRARKAPDPKAGPPPAVRPDAWIQQELLPRGGTARRNGEEISAEDIACTLKPGRYVYTYEKAGCGRKFRAELDLLPGRRYGLCVNLDSPFSSALTDLDAPGSMPPAYADLAKLPDGRWIAAYCRDSKIMLATSRDLRTWTKPWPLPLCSIFRNTAPSLWVDSDGSIHLAYFSKRLDLAAESSGGYRLWLTQSRDGKTWSLPKPICGLPEAQYQNAPAQMLRAADGRVWMFWRNFAASAETPLGIQRLEPLNIPLPPNVPMGEAHVCAEPAGPMHLTFACGKRIYYSACADGKQWRQPVTLLELEQYAFDSHPQVICRGQRIALLYETAQGAWLCRGRLGEAPSLGEPIKITGHVRPLAGGRVHVTPAGEVLLLTGGTAAWLMRANLEDVLAEPPKRAE